MKNNMSGYTISEIKTIKILWYILFIWCILSLILIPIAIIVYVHIKNINKILKFRIQRNHTFTDDKCPICLKQSSYINDRFIKYSDHFICENCTSILHVKHIDLKKLNNYSIEYLQEQITSKNMDNFSKSSEKSICNNPNNNYINDEDIKFGLYTKEQRKIENKYRKIISMHYDLLEKIDIQYSIAINQPTIFNKEVKKCISLCMSDIAIAPQLMEYFKEEARVNHKELELPTYDSFKRVSLLYEKQGDLWNAILFCKKAIIIGFLKDGTKSGYQGRIARLLKKLNQKENKAYQYDYNKNLLYDFETGEIINIENYILTH